MNNLTEGQWWFDIILSTLKKTVINQLDIHWKNQLNEPFWSAYKIKHSAQTTSARIINDISKVIDNGRMFGLLDLSTAFDVVDHDIFYFHVKK